MTMADDKCDVCGVNPPIGVASTMIPLSCAYCIVCLERHAQPDLVFVTWADTGITPEKHVCPNEVHTYVSGEYITYTEWFNRRKNGTDFTGNFHQSAPEGSVQAEPGLPKREDN